MLLLEGFQPRFVLGLQLFARLDLYSYLSIADDGIYLLLVIGVPIGYLITLIVVTLVGNDFLHHKMLKCVAVIVGAPFQGVTPHQVVGKTHVEVIESGRLDNPSLDFLPVGGNLIADKCVIENLEI